MDKGHCGNSTQLTSAELKTVRSILKAARLDHVAIPVDDKDLYADFFESLGFEKGYDPDPKDIGDAETSMNTSVFGGMFALMTGIEYAPCVVSQITEYLKRSGNFSIQHIAIRVPDLRTLVALWETLGIRFITEENGHATLLRDTDHPGADVLQCFTYPLCPSARGLFFELKQVFKKGELDIGSKDEFRDQNVSRLWHYVRKAIDGGWLFDVNIFGEKKTLKESVLARKASPCCS